MGYKKIILSLVWTILIFGVGVLLYAINLHKKNETCQSISIEINNSNENHFIDSSLVMDYIEGNALLGNAAENIDASKIEALLEGNPHIKNAEVYKDLSGTLFIKIWQRNAVMHVINSAGEGYYIDDQEMKIPLSDNFSPRVLVCHGNIEEKCTKCDTINSNILKTCSCIAQFVHNSSFWGSAIEEIFVSAENEILLTPKMGDAKIVFGDASDVENKFDRLFAFYKQALSKKGWDKYSSINLSFKNQIVAKKK